MIIRSNSSNTKNKILPNCLQGNYRDSVAALNGSTSDGVFGAEMVKKKPDNSVFTCMCTEYT